MPQLLVLIDGKLAVDQEIDGDLIVSVTSAAAAAKASPTPAPAAQSAADATATVARDA